MLDDTRNNFICAICQQGKNTGLCFADISTGEVEAVKLDGDAPDDTIIGELGKFMPSEVLVDAATAGSKAVMEFLHNKLHAAVEAGKDSLFEEGRAALMLMSQFQVQDVSELGFTEGSILVKAVGALISYLHETQKNSLMHINHINFYRYDQYMQLDITARRNLELTETLRNKEKRGSLLWVLDKTRTAMGSRLLRQWLDKPLLNVSAIQRRLDAVEELCMKSIHREELAHTLRSVLDVERLISKIVYGVANGRDLNSVAQTLAALPKIKENLREFDAQELREIDKSLDELEDIKDLIQRAICDEPPVSVREGKIIRKGFDETVDELRDILENGKNYVAKIESDEREKTGIKNLKVGYNRVFGYYIEVSKSNIGQAPDRYIRKQTLANCERYFTEELKEMESTILGAQDRITDLEYDLFREVCADISKHIDRIQQTAQALGKLDVLVSFSRVSVSNGYVMPKVDQSDRLRIKDGRHPVVEQMLTDGLFVPNDTEMDCGDNRMAIITGPNMAGKSTYMRQVALIVLMAQIGCFVPAKSAEIGVVDKIFTRIGASDDLTSGQSTFMVEMSEVADIIRNATQKSLLLLDEIGRGTSTFDGMSIARAVIEYTADKARIGAKTLFATHYHELTELEGTLDGVKNYNIAVKKRGDDITFLRKIVRGGADDSYGIEVAKLAGIPETVIKRAKEVLDVLEAGEKVAMPDGHKIERPAPVQGETERRILEKLRRLDANILSPIEALSTLFDLTNLARDAAEQREDGEQ